MKETECATKYPIMLIHGIGYRDDDHSRYWGQIPDFLQQHGASVFFGNQEPFGTIRDNAFQLEGSVNDALEKSGAEKLNLIAHSKGGLEARYLISCLDMKDRIASLTTLATPHRGILSMDKMKNKAGAVYKGLLAAFNLMLMIDGGDRNRSFKPYQQLTADYMSVFNQMVPNAEEVYYQSYAFDMKKGFSDPSMALFYHMIRRMEGPNDGLVCVDSARWGRFRGIFAGENCGGISHPAAADSGMTAIGHKKSRKSTEDILCLYREIAAGLKDMGY